MFLFIYVLIGIIVAAVYGIKNYAGQKYGGVDCLGLIIIALAWPVALVNILNHH